jgi:hypothetical protein
MPLQNPASTVDDAALKHLESLEAEQAKEFEKIDAPPIQTKEDADRPAPAPEEKSGTPDSKDKLETPSVADKEIETAKTEAEKEGKELDVDDKGTPKRDAQGKFIKRDKAPVEQPVTLTAEEKVKFQKYQEQQAKGKYAKDAVRKDNSWKALNEEKEKFKAETETRQKALQGAIAKFNADVAQFRTEQSQTRQTPERFEAYATKLETDAKLKEAEIIKAEAAGDMDAAKKLYAETEILKDKAVEARKHAEHLRKNPPPNEKQIQEKFKADQGTWIAKANTDFPEFAKKDSCRGNIQRDNRCRPAVGPVAWTNLSLCEIRCCQDCC